MKKALIYIRTSSDKQIDNTSLPVQEEKCRIYCQNEGYGVYEVLRMEAVSAKTENEKRVDDLLNYCKKHKGKFDMLVVYNFDRFARDAYQHLYLRKELKKLNITVRSSTQPIRDDVLGQFMEIVLAGLNQTDNETRRLKVKDAMYHCVDQGLWPWAPPVGYFRPKTPGVRLGNCEWDPNCAKEIARIFELYSTGSYTFSSLATLFYKKQIKNYHDKTIKFSKQLIQRVLNNQFYIGLLKVKDHEIRQGKHKPLIPISLWQKCQDLQNKKSNHAVNHRLINNPDFPLRRFTQCGFCHHPLTACWTKGGSGGKYAYYYCVNKGCSKYGAMVKKKDIHDEFYDYLAITKPKEEYLPLFKVIFMAGYKEYEKDFKGDYLRKFRDLERLKQEKKEIGIKGAKGIYPDLTLKEMLSDYEQKILLAQNSLDENSHEEQEVEPLLDRGLAFIRTLEKGWSDLPPENKPRLQRVIYPEGVSYHFKGFSNSGIAPAFALINNLVTSSSTSVTPSGFEPL